MPHTWAGSSPARASWGPGQRSPGKGGATRPLVLASSFPLLPPPTNSQDQRAKAAQVHGGRGGRQEASWSREQKRPSERRGSSPDTRSPTSATTSGPGGPVTLGLYSLTRKLAGAAPASFTPRPGPQEVCGTEKHQKGCPALLRPSCRTLEEREKACPRLRAPHAQGLRAARTPPELRHPRRRPQLTLELGLHLPGAGGEPSEHVSVLVLEQSQAGPLVRDAPAQLREALPVQPGGEEQAPAVPLLRGQVGVEVDDRKDIQDALELLPGAHLALGHQRGQVEGRAQDEEALVDDHPQERGHVGDPEHPVFNHGVVTGMVQPGRPQKPAAI